jgi:hypothetical protein
MKASLLEYRKIPSAATSFLFQFGGSHPLQRLQLESMPKLRLEYLSLRPEEFLNVNPPM